jgi:excisionase family DNA binding protein
MDERAVLSVKEAAKALGLNQNGVYEAVNRGDIPSLRVGGRILIPRVAFDRWLESAATKPVAA